METTDPELPEGLSPSVRDSLQSILDSHRALARERDTLAGRNGRLQQRVDQLMGRVTDLAGERDHLAKVNAALGGALEAANEAMDPLSKELEDLRHKDAFHQAVGQGPVKPADMGRTGNYLCIECKNNWFITAIVVREDGAPAGRLSVGTCNQCGTDQVLAGRGPSAAEQIDGPRG